MHLGHLRSIINGEGIKRLHAYAGHETIGDIHYADCGLQMAALFYGLNINSNINAEELLRSLTLNRIYQASYEALQNSNELPDVSKKIKSIALKIQGVPFYLEIAQALSKLVLGVLAINIERLDAAFEHKFGESRYIKYVDQVCSLFEIQNLTFNNQGNILIPLGNDLPPLFLKGKDGFLAYSSYDMAAIYDRIINFKADKIVYVIGERQSRHWQQIFTAWHTYGWKQKLIHVPLGKIKDENNIPYKLHPYQGKNLISLIDDITKVVDKKIDTFFIFDKDEERSFAINKVSIALLKLLEFSQNPSDDYTFDLLKVTAPNEIASFHFFATYYQIKNIVNNGENEINKGLIIKNDIENTLSACLTSWEVMINAALCDLSLNPLIKHLKAIYQCWKAHLENKSKLIKQGFLDLSLKQAEVIMNICAVSIPQQIVTRQTTLHEI